MKSLKFTICRMPHLAVAACAWTTMTTTMMARRVAGVATAKATVMTMTMEVGKSREWSAGALKIAVAMMTMMTTTTTKMKMIMMARVAMMATMAEETVSVIRQSRLTGEAAAAAAATAATAACPVVVALVTNNPYTLSSAK